MVKIFKGKKLCLTLSLRERSPAQRAKHMLYNKKGEFTLFSALSQDKDIITALHS